MRVKSLLIFILLITASLPTYTRAQAAENSAPIFNPQDIIPGELIVILKKDASLSALSLPEHTRAAKKRSGLNKLNALVINVPAGEESAYILKLKKQKDVLTVEPNYRVSAAYTPSDTFYASQNYLPLIQAPAAWDITHGSNSVILAIIDSGLDATHPEFAGRTVSGYDFVQNDATPQDECGHGTHVAGIAAATGDNAQGIAGIAWGVKIMPLRVLGANCGGDFASIASALIWAADHGAKVINLSLGGNNASTLMENAAYYAYTHGAAVFVAAGNNGGLILYPARYDSVMAIGSVDASGERVPSSSFGATLDLMAPGDWILSTMPMKDGFLYNTVGGKSKEYDYLGGTSMATPHAAGAAALLASMPGNCFDSPQKIYNALKNSALDLVGNPLFDTPGVDNYYGYGLIQINDALAECPVIAPTAPFTMEYDLLSSETCSALAQYNWLDATSGTAHNLVPGGDTGYTALQNLPFNFNYGGTPTVYTQLRAHANGFITFGSDPANISATDGNFMTNAALPTGAYPNDFIAPFWDNLTDNSGIGKLYTQTFGSAPNRQFVIEYKDFQRIGVSNSRLNFEVILYESSNQIKFQYRSMVRADGSTATIGLEYGNAATGLAGYPYAYNQIGAVENNLALLFIPYLSGDNVTLPSELLTCPQTRAKNIPAAGAHTCAAAITEFDVEIAAGALPYRTTLKVQQLTSAPAMPETFLDMQHYADIQLRYAPPAPILYPLPAVDVCYAYSPQDVLRAGGHPENLFIAAHSASTNQWSGLPTTVDKLNMLLMARAPHFSYYGVAARLPQHNGLPTNLPVTGSPLSREFAVFILFLIGIFLLSKIWLRKKIRQPSAPSLY